MVILLFDVYVVYTRIQKNFVLRVVLLNYR